MLVALSQFDLTLRNTALNLRRIIRAMGRVSEPIDSLVAFPKGPPEPARAR